MMSTLTSAWTGTRCLLTLTLWLNHCTMTAFQPVCFSAYIIIVYGN